MLIYISNVSFFFIFQKGSILQKKYFNFNQKQKRFFFLLLDLKFI